MEAGTNLIAGIGHRITSEEDLLNHIPSIFSSNCDPRRSSRYSFIDTKEMLEVFNKFGWEPYSGKQDGSSKFSRHIIRLQNLNMTNIPFDVDDVRPHIILDNSHNGSSYAQIHIGLMRKVCSNGLVVDIPGMTDIIKFKHIGINTEELKHMLDGIIKQYSVIVNHVDNMQKTILDDKQKIEFVVRATAYREPSRFINEGNINVARVLKAIDPEDILTPLRDDDKKNNLWMLFNIVQEKMVKGEFHRFSESGRNANPRGIFNANRGIIFNKALWRLTEEYLYKNLN